MKAKTAQNGRFPAWFRTVSAQWRDVMYLIKQLWVDPLENRNAWGFTDLGVVATKEEADRICASARVLKSEHPWPLNYTPFEGDYVPRFLAVEVPDLTGETYGN